MDKETKNRTHSDETSCGSESPEEQIKKLQEIIADLERARWASVHERSYVEGGFTCWAGSSPREWPEKVVGVFSNFANWAMNYVHEHTRDLNHLPKEQKQQLITRMAGYCVQEDFDAFVSHLPHPICNRVPELFATMFLIKDNVTKIFSSPFWYISTSPERQDDDGQSGQKDALFVAELDRLYQRFIEGIVFSHILTPHRKLTMSSILVHPRYARVWRSVTSRLCNSVTYAQARDDTFGKQTLAHRKAVVNSMVAEMLADKTFQCLLRTPEDPDEAQERDNNLRVAYQDAAELLVDLSTNHCSLDVQPPSEPFPGFCDSSDTMRAAFIHPLNEGDKRLDGSQVLAYIHPLIYRSGYFLDPVDRYLVCKGDVLVAEKPASDQTEQEATPDKE